MEAKFMTVPLWGSAALTFILNKDLGCYQASKVHRSVLGWSRDTNQRVDAMYRMDNTMVHIGPMSMSYTNVYERVEDE